MQFYYSNLRFNLFKCKYFHTVQVNDRTDQAPIILKILF